MSPTPFAGSPPAWKVKRTGPVVTDLTPAVVPVTSAVNVQDVAGSSVAASRPTVLLRGSAVTTPSVHVVDAPLGEPTARPGGSGTSTPTLPKVCAAPVPGLATVNVIDVEAPRMMDAADITVIVAGSMPTTEAAFDIEPVTPVAEIVPVVFVWFPFVVTVSSTWTEQVAGVTSDVSGSTVADGSVPPLNVIVESPGVAATVPPQSLVAPFGVATTSPAGRLSVNAMPVAPSTVSELEIPKFTPTSEPVVTTSAKKLLLRVGAVSACAGAADRSTIAAAGQSAGRILRRKLERAAARRADRSVSTMGRVVGRRRPAYSSCVHAIAVR